MFYTNVHRKGSNLLVRGYDNGLPFKTKVDFLPKFYVPSNNPDSEWRSLKGDRLEEIEPGSMFDCKTFLEKYKDVEGFTVHGNTDYAVQYIGEKYTKDVPWNFDDLKIAILDIETKTENGYPNIEYTNEEISLITIGELHSGKTVTFGTKEYKKEGVKFFGFSNEREMLNAFLQYWSKNYPDIITGWNTEFFDIPYLVRRIEMALGEEAMKLLSPWGIIDEKELFNHGKNEITYVLVGISHLDYLAVYKKFTYKARASYKLDSICEIELKEKKLDYSEFSSFKDFYTNNWNKFVDYNIHDVVLVMKLENKLSLIRLIVSMAYDAKINFETVFSPVNMWDSIIYNHLLKKKIAIPPKKSSMSVPFEGGFVGEPRVGLHTWVASFDAASLYPSIIQAWNISPETYLGVQSGVDVDQLLEKLVKSPDPDTALCANGAMFDRSEKGILGELIDFYMDKRNNAKKQMLSKKSELELVSKDDKDKIRELERDIAILNNIQMVTKIANNSLFGALGNAYFRYFNINIARAITLTGQYIIKSVFKGSDIGLNKLIKTEGKLFGIYCDTDSVYLNLEEIVNLAYPGRNIDQTVKFLDKLCQDKITPIINEVCTDLQNYTNAFRHTIIFKREAIADRGIFVAKKKYGLNVYNNEGVQYTEPDLKIMGLSMIQSSTPPLVAEKLKSALSVILQGSEEKIQDYIKEYRKEFNKLHYSDIAKVSGVNGLAKYRGTPIYAKGTPMNSRAALLYNHYIKKHNLDKNYEMIQEGDKIKFIQLLVPNPIQENIIAFNDKIPPEFGLDHYIDYDTQFNKVFLDAIDNIITVLNWNTEKQASVMSMFE